MGVLLRRRIVLLRVVLFSFLLLLVSPVAHAEKRVALIIGNSAYRPQGELTNPRNDATDVAAALKRHGFQVIEGLDLDKVAFDRKLRDFAGALVGADVGLFFYAGHGLQVSGNNYIIPVDAEVATESALDFETVRLDLVQKTMERAAATNILIVDACRNNPFTRNLARAMGTRSTQIGRGLAPVEAGFGTLISFSTQPGAVADDGKGRNSPFTGALVKHLLSSNEEIMALLLDVRVDVIRETNRRQVPWEHTALTSRFYFKTPPNAVLPAPAPNPISQAKANEERNRVLFDQAQAAQKRGDFDRAIADYSEVIRLNPGDPRTAAAFNNRGNAYVAKKEFDRAIADFSEVIRFDPNNASAFVKRGLEYAKKIDFIRAIADFDEAIRLDPFDVRALYNRGNAYSMKGDPDRAISDFNEAIRIDPKYSWAFNNRGMAYARKNDLERALADFNEAIRQDPTNAPAFLNRGNNYGIRKDHHRALADYDEAIRLDPNFSNAFYFRGQSKLLLGDRSGFDADMAKARQLDPRW
jgi:tetratricopeptide (TPR) repeat protein